MATKNRQKANTPDAADNAAIRAVKRYDGNGTNDARSHERGRRWKHGCRMNSQNPFQKKN